MPFISHCHCCKNRGTKANLIQWVNDIGKSINKQFCGPLEGSEIEKYVYTYKQLELHSMTRFPLDPGGK